jgi:hypothetical protein
MEVGKKYEFDAKKVIEVDIDKVHPNTWNPKDKGTDEFLKIKRGIEKLGSMIPPLVREDGKGGYEILDGEQRFTACEELGIKKISVHNYGEVPDEDARAITVWAQQQVPFNPVSEAEFVKMMINEFNAQDLMPYTPVEIDNMLEVHEFDWGGDFDENEVESDIDLEAGNVKTLKFVMAADKYNLIMKAIKECKHLEEVSEDSRALELICADYLSGVGISSEEE